MENHEWPMFSSFASEQGSTLMTRTCNVLHFFHPVSMLTVRLLPSPLRAIYENLVLWNELIKIESLPWKIWRTDDPSVSLSSEQIDEGLKLRQRANYTTRNASLPNLSRSVVIRHLSTCLTKPSFTLPPTQHHSGLSKLEICLPFRAKPVWS